MLGRTSYMLHLTDTSQLTLEQSVACVIEHHPTIHQPIQPSSYSKYFFLHPHGDQLQ